MKPLQVIRLRTIFHDGDACEVEHHDLFELFGRLELECLNILAIRKNSFFVVLTSPEVAIEAFRKLHNYIVEPLHAQLLVQFCYEGAQSSFVPTEGRFRSVFELEVPELPHFDALRRFTGVENYNFERLRNLCEKEFFEGTLEVNVEPPQQELRSEC